MGEMPEEYRRQQLAMTYWVSVQGHKSNHPPKNVTEFCWEHGKKKKKVKENISSITYILLQHIFSYITLHKLFYIFYHNILS